MEEVRERGKVGVLPVLTGLTFVSLASLTIVCTRAGSRMGARWQQNHYRQTNRTPDEQTCPPTRPERAKLLAMRSNMAQCQNLQTKVGEIATNFDIKN